MTQTETASWECKSCVALKQDNQSSESESTDEDEHKLTVEKNSDGSKLLNEQIATMNQMLATVLGHLEGLEKKVDRQCETTEAIEKSMEMLASKYDELVDKTRNQGVAIEQLKETSEELAKKLSSKDAEIAQLKESLDSVERYTRRKNIEIHGIPESSEQDLHEVLTDLSRRLAIQAPAKQSLEAIHRIKAGKDKIRPIIVRFTDQATRDLWLSKRTALRGDKIFINENLTRYQKKLFWQCRSLANLKNYKFVWTRNGKVFARKVEGASVIKVDTENDLEKIV